MSGTTRVAIVVFLVLAVMTLAASMGEHLERNPDVCNMDEVCP